VLVAFFCFDFEDSGKKRFGLGIFVPCSPKTLMAGAAFLDQTVALHELRRAGDASDCEANRGSPGRCGN
jgi:hypothetical protein